MKSSEDFRRAIEHAYSCEKTSEGILHLQMVTLEVLLDIRNLLASETKVPRNTTYQAPLPPKVKT